MGRPNKAATDQRTHCVSVRFSDAEYLRLVTDAEAQHKQKGAILRGAYLHGPRPSVPPVNLEKWGELSRALSNLNQIAQHLNSGGLSDDHRPLLASVLAGINDLRAELKGQKGAK